MYLTLSIRDRGLLLAALKLMSLELHRLPREVSSMLPEEEFGQTSLIGLIGKVAALRPVTTSEQEMGELEQDREELDAVTLGIAAATFDGTVQAVGLAETLTLGQEVREIPLRVGIEPGEYGGYPRANADALAESATIAAMHGMLVADPDLVKAGTELLRVLRSQGVREAEFDAAVEAFDVALTRVTTPFEGIETTPVGWDHADTAVPEEAPLRTTSECFCELIQSMKRDGVVFENEPPPQYLAQFISDALDNQGGNGYISAEDVDTLARAFESIGETLDS